MNRYTKCEGMKTQWTSHAGHWFARFADGYRVVRRLREWQTPIAVFETRREAIAYMDANNPFVAIRAEANARRIADMIAELKSLGYKVTKR